MKARRILIAVTAALVLLFVAGWWTQRPLARIPLLDGGELLLVEMRYGPTVRVTEPIGVWEHVRHYFSRERNTPLRRSVLAGGLPDSPPRLWMIFEHRGGKLDRDTINTVDTLDPARSEPEVLGDTMTLLDGHATRKQYLVVGLGNYPRRSPQLHVVMNLNNGRGEGHNVDFTVRNPFPITDAPQWTPEPIPQVRKFKYGEFALRGLPRDVHMFQPQIELLNTGAPFSAFNVDFRFRDATGNVSKYILPPSESAWNLHYTVAPNWKFPFPEEEFVPFAHTTAPGPGEYRLFPLPAGLATEPYRDAVLTGFGTFQIDLKAGFTIKTVSPRPSGTAHEYGGPGNEYECYGLELFIIKPRTAEIVRDRPTQSPWILRAIYGSKTILAEQRGYFYGRDAEVLGIIWDFRIHELPGRSIPAETPLEIQFIPVVEESVDFFIEPPK